MNNFNAPEDVWFNEWDGEIPAQQALDLIETGKELLRYKNLDKQTETKFADDLKDFEQDVRSLLEDTIRETAPSAEGQAHLRGRAGELGIPVEYRERGIEIISAIEQAVLAVQQHVQTEMQRMCYIPSNYEKAQYRSPQ